MIQVLKWCIVVRVLFTLSRLVWRLQAVSHLSQQRRQGANRPRDDHFAEVHPLRRSSCASLEVL
jgi:hypothetical protein